MERKSIIDSWGKTLRSEHTLIDIQTRQEPFSNVPKDLSSLLPFGNGRSYGDSCLNPGGALLKTGALNHFISFDPASGMLICEAGIHLCEILRIFVPRGWFLPVTPGTRHITVGGAVANDVHGKNHHRKGTFGAHIHRFELCRSDGSRHICSRDENRDWFLATVGGLGLTGVITWVEIALSPISGPWITGQALPFGDLEEFFSISSDSDNRFEYTVAWIDCCARGSNLGRGIFFRGDHRKEGVSLASHRSRTIAVPFSPPVSLINGLSLRAFNTAYYHRHRSPERSIRHYESFFYPLDGILKWNRIYGPRGFYQYQCVIPPESSKEAMREVLKQIGATGMGSFLGVLKNFGDHPPEGMLSFPMPGLTLALDFPNTGEKLHRLFQRLDALVLEAGGRLYPAKDARMTGTMFRRGYPEWQRFSEFIDPKFSSGFWRRVMAEK
jgi:FAD/FMN-containing dehydrogenase